MKRILALGLVTLISMSGCARSTFYNGKDPILKTQANITGLSITKGDYALHVDRIDHSTPTRAGGSVIGTFWTGFTSALTAWLARGL